MPFNNRKPRRRLPPGLVKKQLGLRSARTLTPRYLKNPALRPAVGPRDPSAPVSVKRPPSPGDRPTGIVKEPPAPGDRPTGIVKEPPAPGDRPTGIVKHPPNRPGANPMSPLPRGPVPGPRRLPKGNAYGLRARLAGGRPGRRLGQRRRRRKLY